MAHRRAGAGRIDPRRRWFAALLLVIAVVAAACGGDPEDASSVETTDATDDDSTDAPADGADPTTEETTAGEADAAGGDGEPVTIRYATVVGENDTFMQQAQWWMDQVTEATDGQVDFEVFYSSSLLGPPDMLQGIADGRVDAGHVANVYAPDALPLSQVTVPFLTTNSVAAVRAWEDLYASNEAFRDEWERNGVKVLAWGIVGPAALGTAEPVDGLDGLSGTRLRVTGTLAQALEAIGVEPVSITLNEVYDSVSRGVLDGYAGLPFQTAMALGMHEVAPNTQETGLGVFAMVGLITMSLDTWNGLPSDVQDAMETAAQGITDAGIELVEAGNEAACDTLREAGGSVTVVPEDRVSEWRDQVFDDLLGSWQDDATGAGLDAVTVEQFQRDVLSTVEEHEQSSSPFVNGLQACAGRS